MVLKTARLDEVARGVGMGKKGSLGHSLAEWAEAENLGQRSEGASGEAETCRILAAKGGKSIQEEEGVTGVQGGRGWGEQVG